MWRPCSFSLTVKVLCIMGVFLEDKQWIKSSTWLFYGVYKKQCKRNNHKFGRNTAPFFTTIMVPSTWYSPSRRKTKLQWFHSHPTALITLQQNFSCSRNWKSVQSKEEVKKKWYSWWPRFLPNHTRNIWKNKNITGIIVLMLVGTISNRTIFNWIDWEQIFI